MHHGCECGAWVIHIARGGTILYYFEDTMTSLFFVINLAVTPSHITDQSLSHSCFPCGRYKIITSLVKGRGTIYSVVRKSWELPASQTTTYYLGVVRKFEATENTCG